MKKKKPEKSQSELDRESKEFFEKNKRELQASLVKYCKELNLDFSPPFSSEEGDEILRVAKQAELEKLLRIFPHYRSLSESEKVNARLIVKFGLDPKLSLRDLPKINEAISRKLKSSNSSENPELFKFKKR